jgi:hypothetical protein
MDPMVLWPWVALAALGAAHGINPGMGWLFAVALGMQEGSGRAVWRALLPLAAGHALAIAAVLGLAAAIGVVVPGTLLQWIVAVLLFALGVQQLVRHRHPRYGGMRVGPRQLTIWSFLMASAHGAGLMALPVVLGARAAQVGGPHAGHGAPAAADPAFALLGTVVHGAGYLAVTGLIALLVYHKVGVQRLRAMWVNVNVVWAAALMITAVLIVWQIPDLPGRLSG